MSMKGRQPTGEPELVLRTFFFSDIVSSTAIRDDFVRRHGRLQGNERYRQQVLEPHDHRLKERFETFEGGVVSGEGDSFFAVFLDARQAIQCAVAIQESLIGDPIPISGVGDTLPPRVQAKIGIHQGTATQIERGGRPNYDDHTINIAHRIQEQAAPDQVLTSREAWRDAGTLEGLRSAEHAGYTFKGVEEIWTLVEVLWGEREPQAPPGRVETPPIVPPLTSVDLEPLRCGYLARLVADHEWLDFSGIPQFRNVVRLKLDDVFVPLSATRELPEGDALRAPRRSGDAGRGR